MTHYGFGIESDCWFEIDSDNSLAVFFLYTCIKLTVDLGRGNTSYCFFTPGSNTSIFLYLYSAKYLYIYSI